MKTQLTQTYQDIISVENLLLAWQEFVRGKRNKPDVQVFAHALIDNILQLHEDLSNKIYKHGGYHCFKISDPKPRDISKASVRDRLVHHAVYRILYPFFDKIFIFDSYSCRINKGTHKAIKRFRSMFLEVSNYNAKTCWVLKCDIKKFFASINQQILIEILKDYIPDENIMWLLQEIISSFSTAPTAGLPLGNLTSQLFVNDYMDKFDKFVKLKLKAKYYIRYADDFIFLSQNRVELENLIPAVKNFLQTELKLTLHPDKIILKTFASGVDFLGWVNFPSHRTLSTATRRRMYAHIRTNMPMQSLQSYLGLLSHGDTYKLSQNLNNDFWLFHDRLQ